MLASFASVVLALAPLVDPPVKYDPQLAVLTATLIAVIWYTYFTYLAVTREERGLVVYDLRYTPGDYSIDLELQNPTRRTIVARVHLRVLLDGTEVQSLPPSFTGDPIRITPLRKPSRHLDLPVLIDLGGPQNRSGEVPLRFSRIRAEITIDWKDDLGESGQIGPEMYEGALRSEWQLQG